MAKHGNQASFLADMPQNMPDAFEWLSFELIKHSVKLWETYREDDKGKGNKLFHAYKIHEMVIQAWRNYPDLKKLRELIEYEAQVRQELENVRKVQKLESVAVQNSTS